MLPRKQRRQRSGKILQGVLLLCIIFFGNSEPYITNISGDKNQVNLAANNAVLHTVQNNSPDIQELERILSNLTQRIPPNISDTEKEKITDSIDVIRTEAQKAQPKKNVLKTALSVLQAIKGSAEFVANVATFCDFIHNLL
ncbi:hypothetical protein [Treponema endosymbiont of Eucomonympha sp.]|uniref:hypothetical protein n=1 Tax=Treponema endosymbiont of Eucomonympha sp. TaxID=1580831 RepID=UPI001E39ADD4|nr:hypothetical protein [Treponema endosymbiont of Eucomonympha sp.]